MANINLTPGERYTFGKLKGVSVITDSTDNAETPKYIRNKLYVTASAAELNVAGVNASVKVSTTSVNDPMLQFSIGTLQAENWTIGIDNTDSGSFKINNGYTLGTTSTMALRIDTNENISIPGDVEITGSFALGGIANTVTTNALYYNPTTKQVTYGASGSGGGGGGTPGGSDTQIQYNNAGVFGGVSALTWDGTTLRATGSFTGSLTGIATSGSSILVSNTPSTSGTFYPVFVNGVSGYRSALVDNSTFTYDTTTNTLTVTASYATNALTASIATTALTASYTFTSLSSSYAVNSNNTNNIDITDNPTYGGVTYYPTFVGNTTGYTNVLVDSSLFTYNPNTNVLSTTASYANNALSASYAANGGVTQLLAGPNVTLSPTNGLGQVTVSATLSGSTIFNTATGSYGSFYDTTTQTNPVADVPRSMSLDTTDITNGVSVSGSTNPFNTYIKTQNAGIYNIQFSAQIDKTDSGADEIVIWLRKNGTDLTDTATTLTLSGNNDKQVAAWNWFVSSATGDYYQIIWRSLDTNLRLLAEPISGTHPGIPSVIVTVNRVDQFLSNTGSFSGSFTGAFTGSFSGSGTITSASYAATASLAPLYLPLTGGTISGNVTVLGTASINTLIVNQIGYSSGSNQLGDAANDTQTLYGSVIIPTGSLTVTGSTRITGSLNVVGQVSSNDTFVSTAVYPNGTGFATSGSAAGPIGFQSNIWRGLYGGNAYSFIAHAYTSSVTNYGLVLTRPSTVTFGQFQLYVKTDNTSVIDMAGGGPILDIANNGVPYSRFNGTNFSVGTTSSLSRLHVRGTGATSATTALLIENANASASLMVRDDGRVGIGTNSPSYTLDVAGAVYFASPVHIGSVLPALSTASGTLYFAGSKMAIFNTGNVIIQNGGTFTDAGYRLDVQGTTRINGNTNITGSITVTGGITGSLLGTASTASFVNTLNQSVIVTGSMVIGSSSLGPFENTLTLGARDTGGEGGQLGLNASGGTYTSASMLDNYQNQLRILRGSNAGSDGLVASWNMHTKQMSLPAYNSVSAFAGTAAANLAVDSSGNVITVSTSGGTVFPYTGNAVITGSLTTTGIIYAQPNGGMYFQGGDDAALYDINVVNTMGIYGVQDATVGSIKLGSGGGTISGKSGNIGIGTINPTSASLTVNGNVWATSFTGSLSGTAATASTVVSQGSLGGGNHYFLISATNPAGGNAVPVQTSNLVYNSTTNTLPTTASWASNAVTASFYGGSTISASFASTASYVNPLNQDVNINGTLTATIKSFLIEHPTQPGKQLQYGNLEGPEHAVYFRGKNTTNTIQLPEEWTGLVDESTITVQLTPIGKHQQLYVEDIANNIVTIGSDTEPTFNYFFIIHAERKDVEKLQKVI